MRHVLSYSLRRQHLQDALTPPAFSDDKLARIATVNPRWSAWKQQPNPDTTGRGR